MFGQPVRCALVTSSEVRVRRPAAARSGRFTAGGYARRRGGAVSLAAADGAV